MPNLNTFEIMADPRHKAEEDGVEANPPGRDTLQISQAIVGVLGRLPT